jgi:predicted dehydrogenase
MSRNLRLGLVGAGGIAQSYIKALEGADFAKLVAIADVRRDVAQAAAESSKCVAVASHEEMAATAKVDGVVICTPPSTHADIAQHFIERGVPVLCEKPLTTNVDVARSLHNAARRKGVILTMGSKFRYVEDVIRAKAIIAAGTIGRVILLENVFTGRVDMSRRWNVDPKLSGGGVLIDNGTHSVDIIRFLLGPIAEVMATESERIQAATVEDTAYLLVRTEDGVQARVELTWSYHKPIDAFITVYGSNGVLTIGWKESKYKQHNNADWTVFGKGYDKVQAFRSQLKNFCDAINGAGELLITDEDAVASVAVIEAAYVSIAEKRWVALARSARRPTVLTMQFA